MYLRLLNVVDSNYCPFVGMALFLLFAIYQTILQFKVYWFDPEINLDLFNQTSSLGAFSKHYAFLIPYKNRPKQLDIFLSTLPDYLLKHNLNFTIFIIEQSDGGLFNRGRLLNSAFDHVTRNDQSAYGDPYDCFVIHDVDLLPTSSQHQPYHCSPDAPLHLSTAIDEMRFNLLYPQLMGGVVSFTPWQFVRVNGFSNLYDGWGAEDDDVAMRVQNSGFRIFHLPRPYGTFTMMKHRKCPKSVERYHLLSLWRRWPFEGLNTIRALKAKMATNVNLEQAETDLKRYSLDSRIEKNYVHLSVSFQ